MADKKISELADASALSGSEVVPIVQGGETVKIPVQDIADLASVDDSNLVHKTGNETIEGVKTFSSSPSIPDGVASGDAVNVGQLNDAIEGVTIDESNLVHKDGAETITGPKTFSVSPTVPNGSASGDAVNKGQLDGKQNSLGFTPENVANKATDLTSPDNTKYPTTQAVVTGINAAKVDTTQYANSPFFEAENGMYYPVIKSEALSDSTGLTNHASGGIVASSAGVAGTGKIYLPKRIDPTKPWRCAVLVEINDSQEIDRIHFGNRAAESFTGFLFSKISTGGISSVVGGNTWSNNYGNDGGIPAGTKIWVGMASDGHFVTSFLIPDESPSRYYIDNAPPGVGSAWDNNAYASGVLATLQNSGRYVFGNSTQERRYLNTLHISNKSTTNRIIGVWWNQGLAGPKDGQLFPPAALKIKVLNDETGWALIPKTLTYQQTDIVNCHHPNGNTGGYGIVGSNGNPQEMAKLVHAGFLLCGITGADNSSDYAGATSSCWGAPTGQFYRKKLTDWVRDNIPGLRHLNLFGQSMGGETAVRYAIQYPNQVHKIIVVSGALGLLDSYTNRGFSSIINNAWGTWYKSNGSITGLNPGLIVTASGTNSSGATTLNCSALASAIPAGTTLTLDSSHTAAATIVTTANASAGATSISVEALSANVASGAQYSMEAHWKRLNFSYDQVDEQYYTDTYSWKNMYVAATAYTENDIVAVAASGTTANTYRFADPTLTPSPLKNIPILLYHGDADTLIPDDQAIDFQTAVNSIGGDCQLVIIEGGTHLSADCYDGDAFVNFFNS